jgi:hypothetical protein
VLREQDCGDFAVQDSLEDQTSASLYVAATNMPNRQRAKVLISTLTTTHIQRLGAMAGDVNPDLLNDLNLSRPSAIWLRAEFPERIPSSSGLSFLMNSERSDRRRTLP